MWPFLLALSILREEVYRFLLLLSSRSWGLCGNVVATPIERLAEGGFGVGNIVDLIPSCRCTTRRIRHGT